MIITLISNIKRILPSAILLFFAIQAHAQIPPSGIYRLAKPGTDFFGAQHYASYIQSNDERYTVEKIPYMQVHKYGLSYALLSADSAAHNIKVAFLRDTVTTKGIEIIDSLKTHENVTYPEGRPYFAKQFAIRGDSVGQAYELGSGLSFPTRGDVDGQWIFKQHANDPYIAIIAYPKRNRISGYDSTTNIYNSKTIYTFKQSFFTSYNTQKMYQDLRYTFDHDSIAVYAAPKNGADVQTYFKNKEYIAVRKDSADWMAVDRVLIKPDNKRHVTMDAGTIQGTTKLKIFSGWVKKEDLVAHPWVMQKQQTKDFRFEISGNPPDTSSFYSIDTGQVDAIKIIHKKTKQQQIISDIGAPLNSPLDNVVEVQDVNFDGQPDINIFGHTGGAGPNDGYNFYLYNPQNGQFEYNEALSNLTQVVINTKEKTITSAFRDGCCHHGGETYTFKNGDLDTLAYWDQSYSNGLFAENISDTLVAGKWKSKSYRSGSIIAKKAPVFSKPSESQTAVDTLAENDMVDIRKKTPLWFYVEATKYDFKNYKSLGNVNGWMRKEAMLPKSWEKRDAQSEHYFFETTGNNYLAAIKIIRKKDDKPVQIITDLKQGHAPSDSLQTGDYNFDGHTDFRLQSLHADQQNKYHDYYMYDANEHIFKVDAELSYLPNLAFDAAKKIIQSTPVDKHHDQKYVHQYQWKNGHLKRIDQ